MSDHAFQRSVAVAAPAAAVAPLIVDGDALFRLNPEWEVLSFGGGRLRVRYERSEAEAAYAVRISLHGDDKASLELAGEPPRCLEFAWAAVEGGVRIDYREAFLGPPSAERVAELHMWLQALGGYLALSTRTTRRARLMRWAVDRIWLRMTPTARRVGLLIVGMEGLALLLLVAVLLVLRWLG